MTVISTLRQVESSNPAKGTEDLLLPPSTRKKRTKRKEKKKNKICIILNYLSTIVINFHIAESLLI